MLLVGAESTAQKIDLPSADAAANAVGKFFHEWNTASNERLRTAVRYPMLTLFGNRLIVSNEKRPFFVDFEQMRENEDWSRSALGETRISVATPEQAHAVVSYSRENTDGAVYRSGRVFYIVTQQGGEWRIQLRSPMGEDTDKEKALAIAKDVIARFFVGWNGENNAAIHETINFPHAFLIRAGRTAIAEKPEDLITDFAAMREREGWDESRYNSLEIAHADERLILAYLTFTRHHADGEVYRRVPVLWMLTRGQDGEWGIQVRAILGSV